MILLRRSKEGTAAPRDDRAYAVPWRVVSSNEVPMQPTAKKMRGEPFKSNGYPIRFMPLLQAGKTILVKAGWAILCRPSQD